MAAQYHSLFTTQGLALLREAIQNGTKLGITHMAYGDGNGIVPIPNADFTKLVNEVYRAPLNRLAPSKENANWLEADGIIPSAVGGFNIREVGLYAGNVLVAYANYPATYKPSADQGTAQIKTIRIVLQIDNTANFELKIDASVVMATIQSVEEAKNELYNNTVNKVESIEDLSVLDVWEGRTVYVSAYYLNGSGGGGSFTYLDENKNINNLGTVINGWTRLNTYYVRPELFGILRNDQVTSYGIRFNNLFNCGYPVSIGHAQYYCDQEIVIQNQDLTLIGVDKIKSKLTFTAKGNGITQKTSTATHTFCIKNIALTTTQPANNNGSAYKYDASEYLGKISKGNNGYKIIENRSLNRGNIRNINLGSAEDIESEIAWKHTLEFLGCMNFSVTGLHQRLARDFTGNGVWIHGDGMPTDMHFSDIYSVYGDKAFRLNDYTEGFHLTDFEIINCKRGISFLADAESTVTGNIQTNALYLTAGHIFAYVNAIEANWIVSAKLSNLELYIFNQSSISAISQGVAVETVDAVMLSNVTFVNSTNTGTTFGIQFGTGWGNQILGCTFKGESFSHAMALGTAGRFYGNTVAKNRVHTAASAITLNDTNCDANSIEMPMIINNVSSTISTSANLMSKNNYIFNKYRYNHVFAYSEDTTITIDIANSKFTQPPFDVKFLEAAGAFDGLEYYYRRLESTKNSIKIAVRANKQNVDLSNRSLLLTIEGV